MFNKYFKKFSKHILFQTEDFQFGCVFACSAGKLVNEVKRKMKEA